MTHEVSGYNPLEIEARADELEAEALKLRAAAKRRRIELESTVRPPAAPSHDLTRREYALKSNVSEATVSRWLVSGMPSIPVGTTVRIDPIAADEWRRARGKKPTTLAPTGRTADVDVDGVLATAGLRVIGGGR